MICTLVNKVDLYVSLRRFSKFQIIFMSYYHLSISSFAFLSTEGDAEQHSFYLENPYFLQFALAVNLSHVGMLTALMNDFVLIRIFRF